MTYLLSTSLVSRLLFALAFPEFRKIQFKGGLGFKQHCDTKSDLAIHIPTCKIWNQVGTYIVTMICPPYFCISAPFIKACRNWHKMFINLLFLEKSLFCRFKLKPIHGTSILTKNSYFSQKQAKTMGSATSSDSKSSPNYCVKHGLLLLGI